jgi:hypothetical protein
MLIYGYDTNYDFANTGAFTIGLIWSDNTTVHAGSVGVSFGANCTNIYASAIRSWGSAKNFVTSMNATEVITIGTLEAQQGTVENIELGGGDLFVNSIISKSSGGAALKFNSGNQRLIVEKLYEANNVFAQVINVGITNVAPQNLVIKSIISDKPAGSSLHGANALVLTNIPSADPLPLPVNGDFFQVTGTTGFGAISGGWCGRRVTLKFAGALTVFDGAIINIAGNFVTTSNDILTLLYDGTQWLEVARAVN